LQIKQGLLREHEELLSGGGSRAGNLEKETSVLLKAAEASPAAEGRGIGAGPLPAELLQRMRALLLREDDMQEVMTAADAERDGEQGREGMLTVRNEREVAAVLSACLEERLQRYPTSIEADIDLLCELNDAAENGNDDPVTLARLMALGGRPSTGPEQTMCLVVATGEKALLHAAKRQLRFEAQE
jgi:hypothetical protein